jgi:hypothetical protein
VREFSKSVDYVTDPEIRATTILQTIRNQDWFDIGCTVDRIMPIEDASFLLLAFERWPGDRDELTLYYYGILLWPIDGNTSHHRRIGYFRHRWTEQHDYDVPNDHYPEFNDFDPANYERYSATII